MRLPALRSKRESIFSWKSLWPRPPNKLVDWSESNSEICTATLKSLATTLSQLYVLGYRSRPL